MHSKTKVKRMSHAQLIDTIMFLLAWLKVNNPEAYHSAEKRAGLTTSRKSSSKTKTGKSGKTKGNYAGLMKAVRANPRMNAASKRKALAKLRALSKK